MVVGKVEHIEDNIYKLHLSSDVPTKPIAGHRFIDLLGENHYVTMDDVLLDLYGLKFVPKNVYMELGQKLEDYVLNYRFPNEDLERFKYEDYRECKSGAFNQDDEDIGGLPDGINHNTNTLIEVKCTTSKFKGFKKEWVLQAQFYAYWWNKRMILEDTPWLQVTNIEVEKYYVPKDLIDAHLKYPQFIIGKNLRSEVYDLETEKIERLIAEARKCKQDLVDKSYLLINLDDNNDGLFFQLKKAMNSKKLVIDYNKEDEDEYRFARALYKTKVGKRKRKKNTKGKVKI
jgi:hypothetical protein